MDNLIKMVDSNITLNLTLKMCISTYRHKSVLTDIGWHVSITYMIFNTQLQKSGDMWGNID